MRTCPSCGNAEPASARFCGECGASLDTAVPAALAGETGGLNEFGEPASAVELAATVVLEPETPTQIAQPGSEWPTPVAPLQTVAPTPPPVAAPPIASSPATARRVRQRWPIISAIAALVIMVGAVAALVATGTVGGRHKPKTPANAAFLSAANSRAIRRLAAADKKARTDLARTLPGSEGSELWNDADAIVSNATAAAKQLRSLTHLSTAQIADRRVLQSFIAANRRYAIKIQWYSQQAVDFSEVKSAAADAATTDRVARDVLSVVVQLPSPSVFTISPPKSLPADDGGSTTASAYVSQVDRILRTSHQTFTEVVRFVPNVVKGRIDGSDAISQAKRFITDRDQALQSVLELQPPDEFAQAQRLLVRSLRLSLSDDQALLVWARARNNGGDAKTQLAEVNRIGAQTSEAKTQFLDEYGPLRRAVTGKSRSSLPKGF